MMDTSNRSDSDMKPKTKKHTISVRKERRDKKLSLEDTYRQTFTVPMPIGPVRDRLSVYKSVPSITTYGLYEKPS